MKLFTILKLPESGENTGNKLNSRSAQGTSYLTASSHNTSEVYLIQLWVQIIRANSFSSQSLFFILKCY